MKDIHHSVHDYPHKDRLIKETIEFSKTERYVNAVYGQMFFTKVDKFFLDLVKRYKLGSGIGIIRTHFLRPGGDHATGHAHGVDTGVYYLQIPENSGDLFFLKDDIMIKAQVDHFVVVPANAIHGVSENKSNELRIALAFDIL